jgi:predicted nuclease of predicted toxin-antitoxin system
MAHLYLDENIGSRTLMDELVRAGHLVTYCRDLGYSKVPDDFHLYVAARRGEVLVTHDSDFVGIHGALYRFAAQHGLSGIHTGILLIPRDNVTIADLTRYIDVFLRPRYPSPICCTCTARLAHGYDTSSAMSIPRLA